MISYYGNIYFKNMIIWKKSITKPLYSVLAHAVKSCLLFVASLVFNNLWYKGCVDNSLEITLGTSLNGMYFLSSVDYKGEKQKYLHIVIVFEIYCLEGKLKFVETSCKKEQGNYKRVYSYLFTESVNHFSP